MQPISKIMEESVSEVFAKIAFMAVVSSGFSEKAVSKPPGKIISRIIFGGGAEGVVTVFFSESVARTATANFLGVEPGDPEISNHLLDAVRELTNTIAGNITIGLSSFGGTCLRSVPEIIPFEKWTPVSPSAGKPYTLGMTTEAGPMTVEMFLTTP